ncbi:IclR family transcriptional regulator [Murinocardiopsis flavida]|uniref:IclR family transcriptional regulator n=1 Tax=Murinocardiopsis flavida TaxID=645275 RepID=A0A2P8CZ45_9ACTN|nr:IclR family transcriptional regulator [Murinocardiopsis flavida]PSK90196.1 IclR family transcriptional regulator [Murinocardiopsis flavida]
MATKRGDGDPAVTGGHRPNASGLRRDVELLEAIADAESATGDGLGVLRLAQRVGRDKSQVSRALATLADAGIISRDEDTLTYRLGWRLYAMAARTSEAHLVRAATPHLRRLVGMVNETAHLCVRRGGGAVTLISEAPRHAFRGLGWEGIGVPLHLTSAGRVLVSEWDPETLHGWFSAQELAATPGGEGVYGYESLADEVDRIRRNGFAMVDEEFEAGLVGVSAPVRDFSGRIVAAVNISAPKARLGARLEGAGALTRQVALELSAELG